MIRAWHFIAGDKLRDGTTAPKDGKWLKFDGKPVMCHKGLHASIDAFDALRYAPGETLCLVDCAGTVIHGDDKLVCTERRIIVRMDATSLLRYFARQQALSVLHLYPVDPKQCMLDFLMGDDAARASAQAAARDVTRLATRTPRSAAESAARSAAWTAAWATARTAAWAATWAAVRAASTQNVALAAALKDFNALVNDAFEDWI